MPNKRKVPWNKGKKLSAGHRDKVIKTLSSQRDQTGNQNPRWKGGKTMLNGYTIIRAPHHPNCYSNGYIPEHRLVMEKHLDRFLLRTEHVHHINGNRTDNRIDNLIVLSNSEHIRTHRNQEVADGSYRKIRPNFGKK